jgi:hypothetical protein
MADVCGPFTLEGLDAFGSIDSLSFSLDSPIWESGDTCILESAADVSGLGTVSAFGGFALEGESTMIGEGLVSIVYIRERNASASATGEGSVIALGGYLLEGEADILGEGTATGSGGLEIAASGALIGVGTAFAAPNAVFVGSAALFGSAVTFSAGEIIGEDWAETFPESNIWIPVTEGSNTWLRNG